MKKIYLVLSMCCLMVHGFLFSQEVVRTFTSSGSFVVPSGVTEIAVECWGGGGSGGGANSDNNAGGGGGGGAYAQKTISVTPGDIVPFSIGTGGSTGTSGGGNGGASSFNTNIVIAVGGKGGGANDGGAGGLGGNIISCVGDVVYSGGNGAVSVSGASGGGGGAAALGGAGNPAVGMTGGLSGGIGGGKGANGRDNAGSGNSGLSYGGGGSGARKGGLFSSNQSGGSGSGGAVVITYTVPSCTGNPNPAGNLAISLTEGCAGTVVNLTATNLSTDFGVEYRWLKSEDNGSNWVNIGSFSEIAPTGNVSLNQTLSLSTLFKIETRCTLDGNATSESNEVGFTVNCWLQSVNSMVTSCSGLFYDSGGSTGNYLENQDYRYTFYPGNPGEKVQLTFTQFQTELGWDGISVYDGNSMASPLISSGSTYGRATCPNGAWTGQSGAFIPSVFLSTAVDGSLTVRFTSDGTNVFSGWQATIACVDVPPAPAVPTAISPVCDSVIINRVGVAPAGETWYWQTAANGISTDFSEESFTVYNSGTYYIRSLKESNGVWSLPTSISVEVFHIPICPVAPVPANLAANVCYDGHGKISSLSWTAVSGAPSYDVYFGADELPLTVTENVTTNQFVLSADLLPSTDYYWKVVAQNTCGELSSCQEWTFRTRDHVCYCTPAPLSVDGQGITNVTMGSINNTTVLEYGNYGDYSGQSTTNQPGETQNFAITLKTGYAYNVKIWIDLNNNGNFLDAGEEVYTGTSTSSNPTTLSGSFLIPTDANEGIYRLRIGATYSSYIPTPCYSGNDGSYEDYTFTICNYPNIPETPISNSPACGSVVISHNGIPDIDETWYWQTEANGISIDHSLVDYTVYQSGTYYIRAQNECGLWSDANSITVDVQTISQVPVSINGSEMVLVGESVDLEVNGGNLGTDAVWRWYQDACGTSESIDEGTAISVLPLAETNTYFVRAEGLCDTTDCVSIVIETFEPQEGDCNVIHVSLSGNDAFMGTSDFPVSSLYRAMHLVNTDRRYIKVEEGLYNENHRINILSDMTIDGGYRIENGVWIKSSNAVSNIHFMETTSGANPTVNSVNDDLRHLIGFSSNNVHAWILQDLKVSTADVSGQTVNGKGSSNYAVWINESIYSINRCEILSGDASNGIDGEVPTGIGAAGGYGGAGASAGDNVGSPGNFGAAISNGASAGIGGVGGAGCSGGCRASMGQNGQIGQNGISFLSGDFAIVNLVNAAYFMPLDKENGQHGGGGGGAGGGGGSAGYNLCGAKKGGNGGNGGRAGIGGLGGQGGGGSFGIWVYNSTSILNLSDLVVSSGSAGDGGIGSDGFLGINGQIGQDGESNEGLCSSSNGGGKGGTGGKGGNGGRGRDGATGVSAAIVYNGITQITTGIIAQTPEIKVYHESPKLCRYSEIKLVKESGSADWDFGIDLQLLNDLDNASSSYTHAMDEIKVYSNLQNISYSLTAPINYSNFIRMNADERTLPQISVPSGVICPGEQQSFSLSATSWGDESEFEWVLFETSADNILLTSNEQEPIFDLSSLGAGLYKIRYRVKESCCGWSIPVYGQFTINPNPEEIFVSGGGDVCGVSANLIATGAAGGVIYWQGTTSNGTSTSDANLSQTVTEDGTYYFRALSSEGCWSDEVSVVVVLKTSPDDVIVSGGGSYCAAPVVLTAQGGQGGLIYWQNTDLMGESVDNQTDVFSVITSGTYYFRSMSPEGCWGNAGSAIVEIQAPPSNLNATSITHFSALLSWTENGDATAWNIEWGAAGFNIGNGTLISNVTQNPYLLTDLSQNTPYDFYVRSVCSSTDIGEWSPKYNFTTIINSIEANNLEMVKVWFWDAFVNVFVPENEQIREFTLYDMQGRLLKTTTLKQMSVDELPNGVYFVRITTDKQIKTKKIQIIK